MPDAKRVTAVVPLYNGERFVAYALRSLFNDPSIARVIVVDDGSVDGGPKLVENLFPQATLLRQINSGVSSARNAGLKASNTEYVLFLDQDDQLVQGGLEKLVTVADEYRADFVYGDYFQVDEDGLDAHLIRQPDVSADPPRHLLERNCSASVCCLYRRTMLNSVGGFDEDMMGCEDWDLYVRLAFANAEMRHVDVPVFKFRYHSASTSKRFWLMWKCYKKFEAKHRERTLALPNGRALEVSRRDRFLNDNLRFMYGPNDVWASWLVRRLNRTRHFLRVLVQDSNLALEMVRRSIARPQS